jgi:hypothetical protein
MNDPQYMSLDDMRDWLNTVPRELTDQEIKGALLRLIQAVRDVKYFAEQNRNA